MARSETDRTHVRSVPRNVRTHEDIVGPPRPKLNVLQELGEATANREATQEILRNAAKQGRGWANDLVEP